MPIDTGGRGYVSKDMKAASDDVWLGHSLADAERADITGFEVCPLVQLLPSLTQNRLRAPSVQFLLPQQNLWGDSGSGRRPKL